MAGDQSIRTSFDHAATPNPAPIKINLRYVALGQGCDELVKVDELWKVIHGFNKVGTTKTSKLLARKSPLLVPITDSIIIAAVGNRGKTWLTLRHCFKQEPFRQAVKSLRPPDADDLSLLRIFDVAIWMLCSNSRAANEARNDAEVSRNPCHCKHPGDGR